MSTNSTHPHRRSRLFSYNSLDLPPEMMMNMKQRSVRTSKCDLKRQIQEEFQEQQKMKRERQLRGLVLGKGLGEKAEKMIFKGFYKPQIALERKDSKDKLEGCSSTTYSNVQSFLPELVPSRVFEDTMSKALSHSDVSAGALRHLDFHLHSNAASSTHLETTASTLTQEEHGLKEGSAPQLISKFEEACIEIQDSIDNLESELNMLCVPHPSFNVFLDVLSRALEVVESGDLKEEFVMSSTAPDMENSEIKGLCDAKPDIHLVGAEEVMDYVLGNMIETAFELVPVTHTAQWVLQFTITFLRSLKALTKEDAYLRLGLLARCVRLLGGTEHFSATLLTFTFLIEEYSAFYELTNSAESNIGTLFSHVESVLNSILMESFPLRRSKLQRVDKLLRMRLQRVMMFISELDTSWRPTIHFHLRWKDRFLSKCFFRIHNIISQCYVFCTHGFVDEALYSKIYDSRVTGRVLGTMASQPQIVLAQRVEYERVVEGFTFQQIGVSVKKHSSLIVGYQICMAARYVLRQSTPEYDKAWGFKMNETLKVLDSDKAEQIIAKIVARAKQKVLKLNRQRGTTVFITQIPDLKSSKSALT